MNRHVLCSPALRCVLPLFLLGGIALQAATILPPAYQTLTSGPGGGLEHQNYPNVSVDISVTPFNSTQLLYQYVIEYGPTINDRGTKANQDLSHFIINLSDAVLGGLPACTANNGCFEQFSITGANAGIEFGTYSNGGQGGSNPGLPGSVYGVKVDSIGSIVKTDGIATITLQFLSNRMPIYGTIYGKGGSDGFFYSTQAIVPDTEIWRGDDPGDPVVPEPGTYVLLGAGLVGIGVLRRRLS